MYVGAQSLKLLGRFWKLCHWLKATLLPININTVLFFQARKVVFLIKPTPTEPLHLIFVLMFALIISQCYINKLLPISTQHRCDKSRGNDIEEQHRQWLDEKSTLCLPSQPWIYSVMFKPLSSLSIFRKYLLLTAFVRRTED